MTSSCLSPWTLLEFLSRREIAFECKIILSSIESPSVFTWNTYLPLFIWTCALEAPIYVSFLRQKKVAWWASFGFVILANLATHPLVTFVVPWLGQRSDWPVWMAILLKEGMAPVIEAVLLWCWRPASVAAPVALIVAALANLWSWWVGAELPNWLVAF